MDRDREQKDLESWNRAIPRGDRALTTRDYVCSDHFFESDVIRVHEDLVIGDLIIKGDPRPPKLKEGAVPSVFNGPKYLSQTEKIKRKPPTPRDPLPPKKQKAAEALEPEDGEVAVSEDLPQNSSDTPSSSFNVDPNTLNLPCGWGVHKFEDAQYYVKVAPPMCTTSHVVKLTPENKITTLIQGRTVTLNEAPIEIKNNRDMETVVNIMNKLKKCEGAGLGTYSKDCKGGIMKGLRCPNCSSKMRNQRTSEKRKQKRHIKLKTQARNRSKRFFRLKKQNNRLRCEVKTLRQQVRLLHKKCQKLRKNQVDEAIKTLPIVQQQAVLACLAAAKRKSPQGNRYELEWIYEALLMRIKSPRLYEHVRSRAILPLPSRTTLNRYMRKLHPGYGYQPQLFDVLKQKISEYDPRAKHGIIVVDEIKAEMQVTFDRHTLKGVGFVDLCMAGEEQEDKNTLADNVLEVIFQPFQGGWYQSLGCFLTNGNASGDQLSKVLIEGIGLCEKAGLKVDAVVTDGATWNRNMWDRFGIGEETSTCEHPVEEGRKLWFFSDWCHLIKCMRNMICPQIPSKKKKVQVGKNYTPEYDENEEDVDDVEVDQEQGKKKNKYRMETNAEFEARRAAAFNREIETPDGMVKRQHWISLLEEENKMAKQYKLSAMTYVPNFSSKHVFPSGFERMNVKLSYQFFSNAVAAGLNFYRTKKLVAKLEDSEATESFVRKVNELADTMNSSKPQEAYRRNSKHEKIIEDYIVFHNECVKLAKAKGKKAFISEPTDLGLLVTLRSTKELCDYLIDEVGFAYVLTARFNQDVVEQFFSNVRSALGPNTHPSPKQYAQIHRLLSVYSLVQPPKGSNVSGVNNLKSLLEAKDLLAESEKERHKLISDILDEVIELGEPVNSLPLASHSDHAYLPQTIRMEDNLVKFMAGFTAFRQKKIANDCENCLLTFTQFREEADSGHDFARIKEIYNGYSYASPELCLLIQAAENAVQECFHQNHIHEDMFITTLRYLKLDPDQLVGCLEHHQEVSKKVIKFYITMRMFFVADNKNKELETKKKLKKQYAKQSKLQ